jgi:E-phenylitaconyl-CoA hydratase
VAAVLPAGGQVTAPDQAEPEVVFEQRGHVAILRLNRPQRANALTVEMRDLVADAWQRVNSDPDCRVVIVTGTGPRHFCTGVDVAAVTASGRTTSGNGHVRDEVIWSPLGQGVRKPVICAVNGLVAGGGLHFVADADIVVAGEHTEFMDTHTSVGMVGAVENIGLTRRLPIGTVLRMTLEGRGFRLKADRAYALGLVDELCPPGQELEAALAIAHRAPTSSPRWPSGRASASRTSRRPSTAGHSPGCTGAIPTSPRVRGRSASGVNRAGRPSTGPSSQTE